MRPQSGTWFAAVGGPEVSLLSPLCVSQGSVGPHGRRRLCNEPRGECLRKHHVTCEGLMPFTANLLVRKASHFLLWWPTESATPPRLILGTFQAGNPPTLAGERHLPMTAVPGVNGLWHIAAAECGLADGD